MYMFAKVKKKWNIYKLFNSFSNFSLVLSPHESILNLNENEPQANNVVNVWLVSFILCQPIGLAED